MSLDARITKIQPITRGFLLHLEPAGVDPAGQERLTLLKPLVWTPEEGLVLWGGSNTCYIIWQGVQLPYERTSYTEIREGKEFRKWFAIAESRAQGNYRSA